MKDSKPDISDVLPRFEAGTIWLCGAGPGDIGLMTCLCRHALERADYIIYDALVNADIFAFANSNAVLEFAGKRGGMPSAIQKDITLRLIELAKKGKKVLRLKGGDPFVFARGAEEAIALHKAKVKFRIVPGVTSGIGGLAYAGIPLTYRGTNQAVALITGHDAHGSMPHEDNWGNLAQSGVPLVFYMGIKHIVNIRRVLLKNGRKHSEPCAIVSQASLPDQKIAITSLGRLLSTVQEESFKPPAIIVVGKIVNLHSTLHWFKAEETVGNYNSEQLC